MVRCFVNLKPLAEKDLGILVDPNFSFDEHINNIVKKANRKAGLVMRTINHKTKDIRVPLFKSLIRSALEYGDCLESLP